VATISKLFGPGQQTKMVLSVRTDRLGRQLAPLHINGWDCIAGLGHAGLVNLSMLCVAAAHLQPSARHGIGDIIGIHASIVTALGGAGSRSGSP
jgi:manganese transport protein